MEQNENKRRITAQNTAISQKRRKKKKMRTAGRIIMAVFLLAVISGVIFVSAIFAEYMRGSSSGETVTVTIPQGTSEKDIAAILKDNGVIDYELSFRLKMKTSPYRGMLKYGNFELEKKMCLDDVIDTLRVSTELKKGVKITIPEGFSAEQIAARCENSGLVSKEAFLKELEKGKFDYDFIKDIPKKSGVKYKLQGYLFPSTHMFDADSTAHDIIDKLLGEFEKQYNEVKHKLPEGMSMNEAIIRASLIEREAKLDSERKTIAGVIENRLNENMLLQIDAAVVYAISDGMYDVSRVLYADLEVDSPYNIYKNPGLPVGAICNPGIESIVAAMEPEHHNYLFYHTDTDKNDGSHIFTETFSQHTNS